jgi:phage tail tape-measure protein
MSDKEQDQHSQNEDTGKLAGLGAGALSGAILGQTLIPIPGVGAVTGAVLGGLVGSEVGKSVGGTILDNLSGNSAAASGAAQGQDDDVLAKLERLAKLKEQGLVTEEEYQAMKKRLLGI